MKRLEIEIQVRRQASPKDQSTIQTFHYSGDGNLTVANWLTAVNREAAKENRIAWECGCMETKCGACAMRVNGKPGLACRFFLKDAAESGVIFLEPLSKFPLVKDLVVDRSSMFQMLLEMKVWMEEKSTTSYGWNRPMQYKASQCLQCGCCLEVCPNFLAEGKFGGAAALAEAYKALEQSSQSDHRREMAKKYRQNFYSRCGQSLSCQNVCPKELPLDEIQARVNSHR